MAAGTVGYSDTRGNKDYTSIIASQIGRRLKEASDMAGDERAFASKQAEAGGTSLEEAGIGKGYFFGKALGSRFGGDRIARTKGRMGVGGAGNNPAANYKQRFRGGFDYNVTNQSITDVAPLSNALVVGLRGVEQGLSDVAGAIQRQGTVLNSLSRNQADMAKATMFNGYLFAMFQNKQKQREGRESLRREEASIEGRSGGRIGGSSFGGSGGGRGMINVTPPSDGGSAANTVLRGLDAFQTGTKLATNVKGMRQVGNLARMGTAINLGEISTKAGKLLNIPATGLRSAFTNAKNLTPLKSFKALKDTISAQSIAGFLGERLSPVKQLKNFFGLSPYDSAVKELVEGTPSFVRGGTRGGSAFKSMASEFPGGAKGLIAALENPQFFEYIATGKFSPETLASTVHMVPNRKFDPVTGRNFRKITKKLPQKIAEEAAPKRIADLSDAGVKTADIATDQLVKQGTKQGLKKGGALTRMMVKKFGAAGTRSLLKKIPVVAGAAGVLFGIQRALEGDFFGAGLEITSGLLGATGVGSGLGLAIDGFLLGRDLGVVPMAQGGIVKGMRGRGLPMMLGAGLPSLVGEGGSDEAVLPLNKKTFTSFGMGVMDAMQLKKSDFVKNLGMGVYSGIGTARSGGLFEGLLPSIGDTLSNVKDSVGNVLQKINPANLFKPDANGKNFFQRIGSGVTNWWNKGMKPNEGKMSWKDLISDDWNQRQRTQGAGKGLSLIHI